ncbi:MAG: hypothetical protein ABID38_04650 [Candidatus Diapherotrites archaeon]
MGKKLDAFLNAISKDLKFILTSLLLPKLWKIVAIILAIIFGIILACLLVIGGLIFGIVTLGAGGGQTAIISFLAIGILVAILVLTLVMLFVGPIIQGLLYNSIADFINAGDCSLGESFQKTKKRYLTILGVNLLLGLIVFVIYIILFIPMLIPIVGILWMLLLMVLMIPLMIIVWPFIVLVAPCAVLSQESIVGVFKRVIRLGKMNFLSNLGYLITLMAVGMVIGIAAQIIILVPVVIIVALYYVHYIVGIIAAIIIGLPLMFAYYALTLLLQTLFITKIYMNNERDSKLPSRV